MFNRIFQHYKGSINELEGKSIALLYSLEDENTAKVYLLWLQVTLGKRWYRIFIDGCYCGVDEYYECTLEKDKDDGIVVRDLTPKYKNARIQEALVTAPGAPNNHIVLSFQFQHSKIELICTSEDGDCVLVQHT